MPKAKKIYIRGIGAIENPDYKPNDKQNDEKPYVQIATPIVKLNTGKHPSVCKKYEEHKDKATGHYQKLNNELKRKLTDDEIFDIKLSEGEWVDVCTELKINALDAKYICLYANSSNTPYMKLTLE